MIFQVLLLSDLLILDQELAVFFLMTLGAEGTNLDLSTVLTMDLAVTIVSIPKMQV